MAEKYVRQWQAVGSYIIKALQSLGGSASREAIKKEIVADDSNDISYENVFEPILSINGTPYIPFMASSSQRASLPNRHRLKRCRAAIR